MGNKEQLVRAIKLAVDAHGMTLDKGGMPYILHPLHVMDCVTGYAPKCVAVLHDTVEDTPVTIAEDRRGLKFRYNPTNSTGIFRFDVEIIDALDAITKRKGEKNQEYWARVKLNPLALSVKLWDMAHNCSPRRTACLAKDEAEYLQRKYSDARDFFAKDDGLMPVLDGWKFADARDMLMAVGYKEDYWCDGWRLIMDANERGTIKIGLDNIIRLVK